MQGKVRADKQVTTASVA